MGRRSQFDDAFPTVVRYGGFVLTFVLAGATIAGHGLELAGGWIAAASMIAYKTWVGGAKSAGVKPENGHDERWSGLP